MIFLFFRKVTDKYTIRNSKKTYSESSFIIVSTTGSKNFLLKKDLSKCLYFSVILNKSLNN